MARVDITWLRYLKFKQEVESCEIPLLLLENTLKTKYGVALTQHFLTLHYSRRIFN